MKRLNNLYYSKRIKELLAELQTAGTTLVVAPMGYGKTLAVQYFLQEQERCGKKVLRQSIYGAGADAFWQGVCHSWQNTELGAALMQQSLPADANAGTLVLELFRQLLPLPSEQQRLLLLMGQPEEFTPEQVAYAYGTSCRESVSRLLECNAFIIRLANGRLRCHHMLKQATRHAFGLLPEAEQQMYLRRLGQWYAQQREYEEALDWLYCGRDFDGLLAAVQQLRDWSMRPQHRQHLFDWLRECPPEILWQYPQAVLIIMRRMFSLNMVPEMLQVKEWYVTALERNTALSQRERDNYYGELEVILSFLAFNSITGMSEHHRRAYKLLSGAPQTLSKQGIWTFGAPSVLGLYLRTGCSLRQTVEDMQECMPPYYLLSGWHGAGAAELTEAEALLLQGRIDEMDMPLQKAYYQAEKHGQECITIC